MDLGVVGMSCRLPGANNLQEYWELLVADRCATGELPPERLDRNLYYSPVRGTPGKTYSTIAGFVPDLPDDPELHDIPPSLLADYSPAARHLLAVIRAAFREAGLDPQRLPTRRVGVYVGHAGSGLIPAKLAFSTHIEETVERLRLEPRFAALPAAVQRGIQESIVQEVHAQYPRRTEGGAPHVTPADTAALAARVFGWEGPIMAVDAACASSLQALALAQEALRQGHCDLAVVGGASCNTFCNMALFSRAQALSDSGSFPFDARANGFVSSDGFCAIVVEPLDRAVARERPIYGVIRGVGCASDGRGHSLWAPDKEGQKLAIERAWGDRLDRARLQYIEAHATSTPVGDAVELSALAESLAPSIPAGTRIPITSVKANVGHTKEAAGLTSLIKVLLAMQHGQIPAATYFRAPQDGVDWAALPFYVPTAPVAWTGDTQGRRAAIDSFGVGGLNAHVVVDEYVAGLVDEPRPAVRPREAGIAGRGCVFAGARNVEALEQLIGSGRSAIVPVPGERWNAELFCRPGEFQSWRSPAAEGGFITGFAYDWRKHKIPPRDLERADPLQFLLLDAAEQALREAGFYAGKIDRVRTAVVVGTIFSGDFQNQLAHCLLLPEFERMLRSRCREAGMADGDIDALLGEFRARYLHDVPALHDEAGSFSSSTLASRIARTFDLKGGAFSVDAGEASSLVAVDAAMDMLAAGRCDAVVCAGAQRMMDVGAFEKLASGGFRTQASGMPIGEGAGVIVLQRAERHHRWILADCRQMPPSDSSEVRADRLSAQIGDTLGASGMAPILGASVRPDAARETALQSRSSLGTSYAVTLRTNRAEQSREAPPRLAMLFSGQGSQYPGMLRDLVAKRPAARAAMEEFDRELAAYDLPSFAQLAWDPADGLGSDILRTELAVVGADYILYRCVLETGLTPAIVAGHSLGEHIALVAAGCITLEQAIRMAVWRDRLLREHTEVVGGLIAISATRAQVDEIAAGCAAPVYVSVQNGARQIVAGGSRAALEEFAARAEQRKLATTMLRVPRPFHTPLMRPIQAEFMRALEQETIRAPRVPLLGTMNCRYLAEPAGIREYLCDRMVTTVRYYDTVARLVREEAPLVLLEVGPRQVLTGLHRDFVSAEVETLASDHPTRGGQQMLEVEALAARLIVQPRTAAAAVSRKVLGPEVVHFDATARRRARNREHAHLEPAAAPAPAASENKLADFLIQFVCERTGYPPDVVDLDADLEADLGIDSIKKVQLLAELASRQVLTVPPEQKLTLRGFPTLRSIMNYIESLEQQPAKAADQAPPNRRYVLRTAPVPDAGPAAKHLKGSFTISGSSPLGEGLADVLRARGYEVAQHGARHLILTQGRETPEPPLESLNDIHSLCQKWLRDQQSAGELNAASITAITAMGGDFGFSGRIGNLLGGGISGLLKGIRREFPELRVKVIDAPAGENPAALAESVIAELESAAPELEVSYVHRRRRLVRAIPESPRRDARHPVPDGGSWIVTGGARGITTVIARELARRYKVRLHLIGLTSLAAEDEDGREKRTEIRESLAALRAEGIEAAYYGCDVADTRRLAVVLDEIRRRGPITGVLHGAAFESSISFVQKVPEQVRKTIATKVLGARNLMDLTRGDRLTHFIAFGSVAGRFGGFGQSDYSAASELLSKMVQRYRTERPDVAAVAFEWPAWSGTGLAMRPQTRVLLEMRGIRFLSPEEGVGHFFAEIEAGCPETEVLFASTAGGLDPDRMLAAIQEPPPDMQIVERAIPAAGGPIEAEVMLHPARHAFLRDHCWRGQPLLPAAASAVMLLEAARLADPARRFRGLRDFVIHNPLRVPADPVAVRLRMTPQQDGVSVVASRELYHRDGRLLDPQQPVAGAVAYEPADEALLARRSGGPAASRLVQHRNGNPQPTPAAVCEATDDDCAEEWQPIPYRDPAQADADDMVFFGPTMRCLRELSISTAEPAGKVIAPAEGFSPALLDACFVACGIYSMRKLNSPVLVHGIADLRLGRPAKANEACRLHYRWTGEEALFHVFDFRLAGDDGEPILEARRCTMVKRGKRGGEQ